MIKFKRLIIVILFSVFFLSGKSNGFETLTGKDSNPAPFKLNVDRSTFLYCSKATSANGNLELQPGENLTWKGNASLAWDVSASSNERYELYLIANVREAAVGTILSVTTNKMDYTYELTPTNGPFIGGRNFERVLLSTEVVFKKGAQNISISTNNVSNEDILFDIRSIELVPVSAKEKIREEELQAINSRESVDWLAKDGYGLMFHWTSQSVQPDGTIKSYEEAVNEFDVDKFANMVEETGAGYIIFTIGHAESYCPAPIKSWEKRHPGKTTKRDLIAEIADALKEKGVKLICYINGPLAFKLNVKLTPTDKEKQDFVTNFKDMLQEMGSRYKEKIVGYWFDSWYQIFEEYPDVPFEAFNKVSKIGNEQRIICLNSWIYPKVTSWQDYWAGEVASPIEIPQNGYVKNGPVPDLPYQVLLVMEPYWVQQKAEMPEPRFSSENLARYIKDCMKNKGAVTINMGIYQNGTVGKKALQVMRDVKKSIRAN